MSSTLRTRRAVSVALATALLVLAGGVASVNAMVSSSTGTKQIKACKNKRTGVLRTLTAGQPKCLGREKALRWNTSGPRGPRGRTGATGPLGPQGATGPQGPPGLSDYQVVEGDDTSVPALGTATATADCPVGTSVLGGGVESTGTGTRVIDSFPSSQGWEAGLSNTSVSGATVNAYAICAAVP